MVQRILVLLPLLAFTGCATTYVRQELREVSLGDSKFLYGIAKAESDSTKRKLELQHEGANYSGTSLGDLSFMDRHLKVFGLAAELIAKDCNHRGARLGKIVLSKDPATEPNDPAKEHPQYSTWEFQCK